MADRQVPAVRGRARGRVRVTPQQVEVSISYLISLLSDIFEFLC